MIRRRKECRPRGGSSIGLWPWSLVALAVMFAAFAIAALDVDAAPVDSKYDRNCTTAECHPVPEPDRASISHPPYLEEWCDRCHTDHSSSEPGLLKAKQPDLCRQCHTSIETVSGTLQHPPGGKNCTECHNPHRSAVRHLLRDENLRLECSKCHEEDLREAGERPFHHKFFNPQTECGSCHHAHQNGKNSYLRANVGETCLTCHDMPIKVEGRNLENVGREIREAKHVHPPLREMACPACHTPHGSEQPSLLRSDYPAGSYQRYDRANYGLCWQCHDSGLVESSPTVTATKFRDGDLNLHQVHVAKMKKGRACHLCHTAHAAEQPHLIRDSITFAYWIGELKYEAAADGGTCVTACHREKEYHRTAP